MADLGPRDVSVVIPTRDRWDVLALTLDALAHQDSQGFEVVVVADGHDQEPPPLPGVTVVVKEHGGPGPARNAGVEKARGQLIVFLGDDTVPDLGLISAHLAAQRGHRGPAAVIGRVDWHPEVAALPVNRWMDRSGYQFDFASLDPDGCRAGWAHFYGTNVSLPRDAFDRAGRFDPDFVFGYEDFDFAWRLEQTGAEVWYEPSARCLHLHPYDMDRLDRRMRTAGRAERRFVAKYPWFEPFFTTRARAASMQRPVSRIWARLEPWVRGSSGPARRVRRRADRWYAQQVATPVLEGWDAGGDELDLEDYLGSTYDRSRLFHADELVRAEAERIGDELTFYRTSEAYLYDLTAFATWGVKDPYLREVQDLVPAGARVLDYGCGIGSDGLRLIERGYDVSFADFDNPSTRYLRWRLDRRGHAAPVFDIENEVPGGFDLVYSFDVIEHVPDPDAFLDRLESLASIVVVNLLEDDPDHLEAHPHHPLPVNDLLDTIAGKDLIRYRRYHGRSHLVAYRTRPRGGPAAVRSRIERAMGRLLPRADQTLVPSRRAAAVRTLEKAV